MTIGGGLPSWQIDMTEEYMKRMKNLVEISKLVTQSQDFFKIKDIIVSKMLDVVHPAKACVNIFTTTILIMRIWFAQTL